MIARDQSVFKGALAKPRKSPGKREDERRGGLAWGGSLEAIGIAWQKGKAMIELDASDGGAVSCVSSSCRVLVYDEACAMAPLSRVASAIYCA